MNHDVIVAGAGIVGVSVALHLQARGKNVLLIDRRGAGEETSFGNAGLVERSSIVPYAFPHGLGNLIKYGFNTRPEVRYHLSFLPKIAPWLARYWYHSGPKKLAEASDAMVPLIERSVEEHDAFAADAGATPLFARKGWIEAFRTEKAYQEAITEAEGMGRYKLNWKALSGASLKAAEPSIGGAAIGGIHWEDPITATDPGAVTKSYAELFTRRGGLFANADATSLKQESDGSWSVVVAGSRVSAKEAVIALGPWSNDVFTHLGYRFPLAVKRGYHMHYEITGGATMERPVVDVENGYVLAPMRAGIRLTTGAEFAPRDARPTPAQLDQVEPLARQLYPLGKRLDAEPWMGRRPATPDMRPVIGPGSRHKGLWFAFGHAHHGFTLGPITGRLLADMMTGTKPVVDPTPYAPGRFE